VDEARGALEEARARNPGRGQSPDERRALGVLAEILAEMGGLNDAMEIANTARGSTGRRAETRPPDADSVRLWRVLGRLGRRELRLGEATDMLIAAAEVAARSEEIDEQVLCLREAAVAESTRQDKADSISKAGQILDQARSLAKQSPSRNYLLSRLAEARAIMHINDVTLRGGELSGLTLAIAELDQARQLLPDRYVLWDAWLDYQRSRVHIELAKRIPDGDSSPQAAASRSTYLLEARQFAQAALDKFAEASHKFGVARARFQVGVAYAREGRAGLALPLLEEARETLFFCGDRWVEAQAAFELAQLRGQIATTGESIRDAMDELKFARATFRALGDKLRAKDAATALASLSKAARRRVRADRQG
jgi:hypothetical protein